MMLGWTIPSRKRSIEIDRGGSIEVTFKVGSFDGKRSYWKEIFRLPNDGEYSNHFVVTHITGNVLYVVIFGSSIRFIFAIFDLIQLFTSKVMFSSISLLSRSFIRLSVQTTATLQP